MSTFCHRPHLFPVAPPSACPVDARGCPHPFRLAQTGRERLATAIACGPLQKALMRFGWFFLSMTATLCLGATGCSSAPETTPPACCQASEEAPDTLQNRFSDLSLAQLDGVWHNQDSQPQNFQDFLGEPVLVAMIFTHCDYACPRIIQDLRHLRTAIAETGMPVPHVLLASFDTRRDVPERLKTYAKAASLGPDNWTLWHGDSNAIDELSAVLGVRFRPEANGMFAHSNIITLLNAKGEICHQQKGLEQPVDALIQALAKIQ